MNSQGREVEIREDGTPSNSEFLFFFLKTAIIVFAVVVAVVIVGLAV